MPVPKFRSSRWRRWFTAGLVVLAGVGCWRGAEELLTRRAYARGLEALTAGDHETARAEFDRCQSFWSHVPEVQYHAALADRRAGDFAAAFGHLADAERLGWNPADLQLERALIALKNGVPFNRPIEADLRAGIERENNASLADGFAALAAGYLGQFRITDVDALTAVWVARRPADANGWRVRADVLERLVRKESARDAYARWVALAPDDRTARLGLIRVLLELRAPTAEVAPHLDRFQPNDPAVLPYRAMSQIANGQLDEATALLDRAIAEPTPNPQALRQRAKLDLDRGRPATALAFARRAVAADAADVEGLFTLMRCLQQAGPATEAAEAEARWKRVSADLTRVNELGRQISVSPADPELRREMGELFLRNGREAEGVRWLESALAVQPNHAATHKALADFYARIGRPERAAAHRLQFK